MLFYAFALRWSTDGRDRWKRLLSNGLVFGALSAELISGRIELRSSVFVDVGSIPLAAIALFEGWPAALVACLPPIAYRVWLGGPTAGLDVGLIVTTAAAGVLVSEWARWTGRLRPFHWLTLAAVVCGKAVVAVAVQGRVDGLPLRVWLAMVAAVAVGIGLIARLLNDALERERLLAAQERFRAVTDEASEAIRILDADSLAILDTNRSDCAISGWPREAMIGRDARDFWPLEPEERARVAAVFERAGRDGFARSFGLPYRTRGGRVVPVDTTHRAVEHRGRRYQIVIFRDATDRQAAEAVRREAAELRAMTLLAGGAAHEINNQLATAVASLDLLADHLRADVDEARLMDRALHAVLRVKETVARMARITRIETVAAHARLPAILDIAASSANEERGP